MNKFLVILFCLFLCSCATTSNRPVYAPDKIAFLNERVENLTPLRVRCSGVVQNRSTDKIFEVHISTVFYNAAGQPMATHEMLVASEMMPGFMQEFSFEKDLPEPLLVSKNGVRWKSA